MHPFETLAWDSEFFGVKIGRIRLESATPEQLSHTVREADGNGVECLYWLVDAADPVSARAAAESGFRLVDVRVTFERTTGEAAGEVEPLPGIRTIRAEDLPAMLELARGSHRESRFFSDGNFAVEKCEALFETWLRKSWEGGRDTVFVADRDGRAVAYCACASSAADSVGTMTLAAVDPRCRRAGVGAALVANAMRYFRGAGLRTARVVTQARNVAALRLYERCGFVTAGVQLWFHRWKEEGLGPRR